EAADDEWGDQEHCRPAGGAAPRRAAVPALRGGLASRPLACHRGLPGRAAAAGTPSSTRPHPFGHNMDVFLEGRPHHLAALEATGPAGLPAPARPDHLRECGVTKFCTLTERTRKRVLAKLYSLRLSWQSLFPGY